MYPRNNVSVGIVVFIRIEWWWIIVLVVLVAVDGVVLVRMVTVVVTIRTASEKVLIRPLKMLAGWDVARNK